MDDTVLHMRTTAQRHTNLGVQTAAGFAAPGIFGSAVPSFA